MSPEIAIFLGTVVLGFFAYILKRFDHRIDKNREDLQGQINDTNARLSSHREHHFDDLGERVDKALKEKKRNW